MEVKYDFQSVTLKFYFMNVILIRHLLLISGSCIVVVLFIYSLTELVYSIFIQILYSF